MPDEKRVTLRGAMDLQMHDSNGKIMFESPKDPFIYHDLKYSDALLIQESFAQAMNDHLQRLFAMGHAHAAQATGK